MFQWPLGARTRLTLGGLGEGDFGELERRRQRELRRRVARTSSARRMGSEPKAGSSSTTKFSRVKPGSGSRLSETLSKWTGRPMEALMLRAMRSWKRLTLSSGGMKVSRRMMTRRQKMSDEAAIAARREARGLQVGFVVGVGRLHGSGSRLIADGLC